MTKTEEMYAAQQQTLGFVVAGADECGTGALAGPVVAACVVLPDQPRIDVRDSKALSAKKRAVLEKQVLEAAVTYGIGVVMPDTVDAINSQQAGLEAIRLAYLNCDTKLIECVLVDGALTPVLKVPTRHIVTGDALVACIAAASIVAKEYRDRYMVRLGKKYPQYGFEVHKGYGTREHLSALMQHGPCPEHRMSYGPVADSVR